MPYKGKSFKSPSLQGGFRGIEIPARPQSPRGRKDWQATHWPIPLLLTAFYATTFFFWYYSVTTEQYTSAVFQTLLVIWLAFKWDKSPRDSTLLWLAFISGTMLANMITTLFILPPLLWFIFFKRTSAGLTLYNYLKRPKLVLQAIGLALLPLLSYAYVYIRGAQHPEWRGVGQWPTAWVWFVQFIAIQQGRDELAPGLNLQTIFTDEFPALMGQELTWLILFGGLAGLLFLGRRRAVFLYSTLVIYFIFSWGYRFGNWFQVIIPAYPIFIIGFAAGVGWLGQWAKRRAGKSKHDDTYRPSFFIIYPLQNKASLFIILLLFGLLVYRFSAGLPRANQRELPTDTGLDPGWAIMADNPNSPALILSDFEERVALEYLRAVWGIGSDITPVDAGSLESAQQNDLLYVSRRAWAVAPKIVQAGAMRPQAAGEQLIALLPTPPTQLPAAANPLWLNFGDTLQLAGWEQVKPNANLPPQVAQRLPQSKWQIALYWPISAKLDADYTISARPLVGGQLVMDNGQAIIQDHQPVWGVYPTSQWQPNELVRDVYALTLPDGVTPDAIQIIIYKAANTGFKNLGEQTISLAR